MKATSILNVIVMMSVINTAIAQGIVNAGSDIYISNNTFFTMTSDFTNLSDGAFVNQGSLVVLEDWTNNGNTGVVNSGTSGNTIFEGNGSQKIYGSHSSQFNNLEIENELELYADMEIINSLKLNSGKINIKNNNLKYSGTSAILTASDNYIIAEESGKLVMDIATSLIQQLPIGTSFSSVPIAITNNAIADEFAVNLISDVLENGISGSSITEIEDCVGMSWNIEPSDPSNADYSVDFQWNSSEEGVSFDRTHSAVGAYHSGQWNPTVSSAASGTNPYHQSLENITYSGTFAIGDPESPMTLPLHLTLDVEAILEGAFGSTEILTTLKEKGLLPLTQPYNTSPWNYSGTESVSSISDDVVDWVLIETRDAPDASSAVDATQMERQAAFLLKDGSIVSLDGSSNLFFNNYPDQKLYVLIHHRNHLSILSAFPITHYQGVFAYDFTSGSAQAYSNTSAGQIEIIPGIWGMFGGDSDSNGTISEDDYQNIWLPAVGTKTYSNADNKLNGEVDNQDKNDIWFKNLDYTTQVPD
jgi:hypothetical protein